MKCIARTALVLAALSCVASAAPPDLKGEYWDEWNLDRVEFRDGGKAIWTQSYHQKAEAGAFSFPDEATLQFIPDGGGAARTCKWALRDGFLALTDEKGIERVYRHETAGDRLGRAADVFVELAFLNRAREANKDEATADYLKNRDRELDARLQGLFMSLGKEDDNDLLKQILAVVAKRRPDVVKDIEAAFQGAREASKNTNCKNGLKQIGIYLALYESKFKKYPKSLAELRTPDLANDEKLFSCPVTGKDDAYVYVFPEKDDQTPFNAVMAYDREAHPDGSRNVLTFMGSVVELNKDEFEKALKSGVPERK